MNVRNMFCNLLVMLKLDIRSYVVSLICILPYGYIVAADCSDDIVKNTCKVASLFDFDPKEMGVLEFYKKRQNPDCTDDSEKYGEILLEVYSRLPEHSKSAFCVIKKILVFPADAPFGGMASRYLSTDENDYVFEPNVYEGINRFKMKILGYVLSLNLSRFESGETEEQYLTRTFTNPFVERSEVGQHVASLPTVTHGTEPYEFSSLLHTVIHEVGHFLDYANDVASGYSISGDFDLDYAKHNFFSFENPFDINFEQDHGFLNRSWYAGLSDSSQRSSQIEIDGQMYTNIGFTPFAPSILKKEHWPIPNENFEEFYRHLQESRFITPYSIASPAEDFAETYSNFVDEKNFMVSKDGVIFYDEALKYKDPIYLEKIEAVKNVMKLGFENELGKEVEFRAEYPK